MGEVERPRILVRAISETASQVWSAWGGLPAFAALLALIIRVKEGGETVMHVILESGVAAILGAVGAVILMFVFNLIRAPFLAERQARRAAEQAKAALESERDALRAEIGPRPQVEWRLDRARDDFLLVVRNVGATAVFHANMLVRSASAFGQGVGQSHRLMWERAHALESKIVTGAEDSCRIAEVRYPGPVYGEFVQFSLYRFDEHYQMVQPFWNVGHKPGSGETVDAIAHFEITITSEPEIAKGPFTYRFQLGPWTLLREGEEGYFDTWHKRQHPLFLK